MFCNWENYSCLSLQPWEFWGYLCIFFFFYHFKLQRSWKNKPPVYLWSSFLLWVTLCVCVYLFIQFQTLFPITYKYFTIYILGIKMFSYITTVNYLNQEVRCWYDTITWIHSPYWNISVCPYYILYGRFLSSTESHIAFFFFFLVISF